MAGVSFDDVQRVVGDDNPHDWAAARIREQLGSGSLSTIQRALATLRAAWDQQQAPPELERKTPDAPEGLADLLWSTAYEAATARVQHLLAGRSSELLTAHEALKSAANDLAEAQAEADRLAADAERAQAERASAVETAELAAQQWAKAEQALREARLEADAERQRALVEHERVVHDLRTQVETLSAINERASRSHADVLVELRRELAQERARVAELTETLAGMKQRD